MQSSSALQSNSPLNQPIVHLTIVVMSIMFAIMLLVLVLVTVASLRYRASRRRKEPEQNFGNSKLELTWTLVPLLLLVCIFVLTVMTMNASDPAGRQSGVNVAPDIIVVGHQFWWEYRYPKTGFVTANEMHVPVKKRVLLRIEAADVIHDFWVPQLGRKMDAIPGHPNDMYFEASDVGEYHGTCAEFCGAEHAWMRILVVAQPEDEFLNWEQKQRQLPQSPHGGDAERGQQLFRTTSCSTCHTISGISTATVGPNLTHLASRQTLASGRLRNTPENLEAWLSNPGLYKPGSYMPNASLSRQDLAALTAYLETLR